MQTNKLIVLGLLAGGLMTLGVAEATETQVITTASMKSLKLKGLTCQDPNNWSKSGLNYWSDPKGFKGTITDLSQADVQSASGEYNGKPVNFYCTVGSYTSEIVAFSHAATVYQPVCYHANLQNCPNDNISFSAVTGSPPCSQSQNWVAAPNGTAECYNKTQVYTCSSNPAGAVTGLLCAENFPPPPSSSL